MSNTHIASKQLSRRNFVAGGAVAAVAAATTLATEPRDAHAAIDVLPDTWDDETDVVVVGYGASGVAAAITGLQVGYQVLVLEKDTSATGGNLGCATGAVQSSMKPNDPGEMIEKLKHFNQGSVTPEEGEVLYPALVEQEMEAGEWLDSIEGLELTWFERDYNDPSRAVGQNAISARGDGGGRELFANLDEVARGLGIDVRFSTPGKRLVRNPKTGEIAGVIAEKDGTEIAIKARKGVILACGGFEGDALMQQWYTGWGIHLFPWGTPLNTGDGIKMAASVGAQMWHMVCSELGSPCYRLPSEQVGCAITMQASGNFPDAASWLFVNHKGARFVNEAQGTSHAPLYTRKRTAYFDMEVATYEFANMPYWMVFDQSTFDAAPLYIQSTKISPQTTYAGCQLLLGQEWTNEWALEQGWIVKADTLEELAAAMTRTAPSGLVYNGIDAEGLTATVATWNDACEKGEDAAFGRKPETMAAFGDGPYYAIEMGMGMINAQGGPKRNENAQTVDVNGEIIGRLYTVGEMGSLNGGNYNLGNIAEAITTGRMAMLHAGMLEDWGA